MLEALKESNNKTKWKDREPYAYWRGNPYVSPRRGELMKCNLSEKHEWNARLYREVKISYLLEFSFVSHVHERTASTNMHDE